jgi:small GTP-binding protein
MVTQKKILLLGDGAVGKTSLVHRFVEGVFNERYKATIGVDIFSKNVKTPTGDVELQLWDLSGQAHFSAVRSKFYNKADGALLVFDLTAKKTFENLHSWLEETKNGVGSQIPMFVLGNKMDLSDLITVQDSEITEFSSSNNWLWAKSSAKTGENVEKAFLEIASVVMK